MCEQNTNQSTKQFSHPKKQCNQPQNQCMKVRQNYDLDKTCYAIYALTVDTLADLAHSMDFLHAIRILRGIRFNTDL